MSDQTTIAFVLDNRHGCFEHVSFDHPMVKPFFDAAYAALFAAEQK